MTTNSYTSFSDLLSTSKHLITTMEKADLLDRLLIFAALLFFLLVCVLIIKRRIIDRGIRAASLVGRVAGGVGSVGKRGVEAVLPSGGKESLAATVSEAAASASSILKATVTDKTPSAIGSAATSVIAGATEAVSPVAERIVEAVSSSASSLSNTITQAAVSATSAVADAVVEESDLPAQPATASLAERVASGISSVSERVAEAVMPTASTAELSTTAVEAISSATPAASAVSVSASEIHYTSAEAATTSLASKVASGISSVSDRLKEAILPSANLETATAPIVESASSAQSVAASMLDELLARGQAIPTKSLSDTVTDLTSTATLIASDFTESPLSTASSVIEHIEL